MTKPVVAMLLGLGLAGMSAAEREWQTGVWHDVKIERPKVSIGVRSNDPRSTVPQAPVARETRTYIIETDTLRLELRQDTTADAPRLEVMIGSPATFAVEKKIVYVRDQLGKEHRLTLRKQTKSER